MVSVASIFSTLGNPNSLVPLAIKDTVSTTGMTLGSFITGKEEGRDRFIDEVGTEAIWLGGIPFFKFIYDNTAFRALNLDSKFDPRNLKDKDVLSKIKEYAPTEEIRNNIEKISNKKDIFKKAATGKFIVSTALTVITYIGLTRFKQAYTDKKIRENLIAEYNKEKESKKLNNEPEKATATTFKGLGSAIQSLAFSPVKNMWVLDGCITAERLLDSRSKQEFVGYAIKEASILFFMYCAGIEIQKFFEKFADKHFSKSIALDSRVIEDGYLQKAFEDFSIEKSLNDFKAFYDDAGNLKTTDAELYEFLHKNPDNLIVKTAKNSDVIQMYKKNQGLFKKSILTDKIDTRKYIDLNSVKDIADKLEKLFSQYKEAMQKGESVSEFFNKVKVLKRGTVVANIAICALALGVLTPAAMLLNRYFSKDNTEFETKKKIREQLINEGIIS